MSTDQQANMVSTLHFSSPLAMVASVDPKPTGRGHRGQPELNGSVT